TPDSPLNRSPVGQSFNAESQPAALFSRCCVTVVASVGWLSENGHQVQRGALLMEIACLDLEGVLIPEIWVEFAKQSGIDALRLTTREQPDYDILMKHRLRILG